LVKAAAVWSYVCWEKFQVGELNFQMNSPSSARYSVRPSTPRSVVK
jgi:hypothetical protein